MDEPKKVAELVQRPLPWRRQKITLYEDRLELEVHSPTDRFRIPFYLHTIKDDPDRVVPVPWLWLVFGAVCLAGGAGLGTPILLAIGGLSLVLHLPGIRPRLVYAYRALGREGPRARYEPHLYLAVNQPSADEVRKFVELIRVVQKRHIDGLKSEQEGEGGITYAKELERFANLRERNVLTEPEFVQVKAKLLNLKPRRIGF